VVLTSDLRPLTSDLLISAIRFSLSAFPLVPLAFLTLMGTIEHGRIVLAQPLDMPDGTSVEVRLLPLMPGFWTGLSLAELAQQQPVTASASPSDLIGNWPDTDSVDDLIEFVREGRA